MLTRRVVSCNCVFRGCSIHDGSAAAVTHWVRWRESVAHACQCDAYLGEVWRFRLMLVFVLCAEQRGRSAWGAMGLTHLPAPHELTQALPMQRGGASGVKMERLWESLQAQASAMSRLAGNQLEGNTHLMQSQAVLV